MIFWLLIYPLSIFWGLHSAVAAFGWPGYNLFMWLAIPIHLFVTSFAPRSVPGRWGAADSAAMVWLAAFGLGTYLAWPVVGVPLQSSWLGYVLAGFLGLAGVLWGLVGLAALVGHTIRLLIHVAPGSGLTNRILDALVRHGAATTREDFLPAPADRTRRIDV